MQRFSGFLVELESWWSSDTAKKKIAEAAMLHQQWILANR